MTTILHRRGTAATWTSANPILGSGELGFETDTGKLKIGNGSTAWTVLAYIGGTPYTDEQVRDVIGAALVGGSNVTVTPNDTANTITISSAAIPDEYLTQTEGDGRYILQGVSSDTQPPSAPPNLILDAPGTTSVTGTWDASGDNVAVNGYQVYKVTYPSGGGSAATVESVATLPASARTATITGLTSNSGYAFRVTAFDSSGNESVPSEVLFTTAAEGDFTAPTVPTDLFAAVIGTTTVQLEANASSDTQSGVVAYKWYQGPGSGFVDLTTPIATTTVPKHTATGLTQNTSYKFRVSAVDGAGNESQPGAAITVTTLAATADTTAPSQVAGVSMSRIDATQANQAWAAATDNSGAIDHYNIYRGIGSGGGSGGGAIPFLTHPHEGTVGTTPVASAEGYGSRTGTNVAYVATALVGSQSLRFDGALLTYYDDTAIGSGTMVWSAPIRLESLATSSKFLLARAGITNLASVEVYTDGTVRILNGANTLLATSSAILAINTWYRIEAKFLNGSVTVRIFNAAGTVLLDTITSNSPTAGVPDALRTGLRAVGSATLIDEVKVANDWITDVPGGTTTSLLTQVAGNLLKYTHRNLTPSTQYTVQTAAVDPSGNEGTKSVAVTFTTLSVASKQIIYGLNTREDAVNDMRLGDRTAVNNWKTTANGDGLYESQGIGMSRCYYSGDLPIAFVADKTTGGFGTNFKKRVNICWKGDARPQSILNKAYDLQFCRFLNSIPADWEVAITWYHEPNGELVVGGVVDPTQYKNAQRRLGALLENRVPDAAAGGAKDPAAPAINLNSGVNVYNAVCFTIWRSTTSNKWSECEPAIPLASEMDAKAILLLDAYQNTPPGGTGANGSVDAPAGTDWTSLYPTGSAVWTFYFNNVHTVKGYNATGHGYGVGEWMAPPRLHDGNDDPTKPWQAQAIEDYLTYLESRTNPPRMILMWENPAGIQNAGASFEQRAYPKARAVFTEHALGGYAI